MSGAGAAGGLVVIGAGGMGREVLDVARALGRPVAGVVDDGPSADDLHRLSRTSTAYLGSIDGWLAGGAHEPWVVGLGDPGVRSRVVARVATAAGHPATLVHPTATLGSQVLLGDGTAICAGVRVSTNVRVGRHGLLLANAAVGHDSQLGDVVSVNPGAVVSGAVTIGEGSLVGAGATVLQGLRVGERCVVGASACVVRDVASDTVVRGVPAR
ncbi:NeuD/PglB/VioB family sugar acetyltransferase [Frigoribacterium sp. RIT-PI-h]|uniref:NeuD/PglB/VioB family sugar acetyltransferase n=1 Tax=Frigoribacterium sp. RIT-PI-h TaxID=1690245 RepID=UPI000AD31A43|nr:NeuD/PglB/VioB family sugar acetyltransferase [Frigoribacterium sp. RIT-PI-h]